MLFSAKSFVRFRMQLTNTTCRVIVDRNRQMRLFSCLFLQSEVGFADDEPSIGDAFQTRKDIMKQGSISKSPKGPLIRHRDALTYLGVKRGRFYELRGVHRPTKIPRGGGLY